jgi:hypothetical protein
MCTIRIAAGVGNLLRRERGELPSEDGWVRVDAVVGELGKVQYLDVDAFLLQWSEDLPSLVHHAIVRGGAFVGSIQDRLSLVQTLVVVVSTPVACPEILFLCEIVFLSSFFRETGRSTALVLGCVPTLHLSFLRNRQENCHFISRGVFRLSSEHEASTFYGHSNFNLSLSVIEFNS